MMTEQEHPLVEAARMRTRQESTAAHPDVVDALIALREVVSDYLGSAVACVETAEETERLVRALEAAARVLRVHGGPRKIQESIEQ
jgi:hypothetical protein